MRGSEVWSAGIIDAMGRNYRAVAHFNCRYAGAMLEPKL
jgi:hypothetical protein